MRLGDVKQPNPEREELRELRRKLLRVEQER
jgi:hypothetical protein